MLLKGEYVEMNACALETYKWSANYFIMIVVAAVQLLGFTMTWLYLAVGRFLPSITYAIMITRGTLNIP